MVCNKSPPHEYGGLLSLVGRAEPPFLPPTFVLINCGPVSYITYYTLNSLRPDVKRPSLFPSTPSLSFFLMGKESTSSPSTSSLTNEADGGSTHLSSTPPPDQKNNNTLIPSGLPLNQTAATKSSTPNVQPLNQTAATKPSTPSGQPLKPVAATKISFAAMASKGLPNNNKANVRSAWSSLRATTESRERFTDETAQSVWFTPQAAECVAAIPFHPKSHLINKVVDSIATHLPQANRIQYTTPGVILVAFPSPQELESVIGRTLECEPSPLTVLRTVYSFGTRIKIRAEGIPISLLDYEELAQKVFGSYGRVLLVNEHFISGTKLANTSFDFILEIPFGSPQDLMIPRVAAIGHTNVLFSWSGSKFCYRCGDGSHTKLQCPKPLDFHLGSVAPLEEPLMARAFPDPEAPLREPAKKIPTPKQVSPPSESEWTEVSRKNTKKRDRKASSGGRVSSASECDSAKPPPRKLVSKPKGSEPQTRTVLVSRPAS